MGVATLFSGLQKLAVCQRKLNEINGFLVCWYKFMKAKRYFNNFLVVVIKNGCGLLGLRTLKSAVLQGPIDEFFCMLIQI